MNPIAVELIGCGAVAAWAHQPALEHFARAGRVRVAALVEPDAVRRAQFHRAFPGASAVADLADLPPNPGGLAIVASPPARHAPQTLALLGSGRHVLCEKPLAVTIAEVESMIAAAQARGRLLAAGLSRRFFPAVQAIGELLAGGLLGAVRTVEVAEGGRYGWAAATPGAFTRAQGGGVLLDLGSHVLDLLCQWFGAPSEHTAQHDALGGVETNALLTARWPGGTRARLRFSWDTPLPAGWRLGGERGELHWTGAPDGPVAVRANGGRWWLAGAPQTPPPPALPVEPAGYAPVFARQLENVLEAIAGRQPLVAPAESALPGLRWLEAARTRAQPWRQSWLSDDERARATLLALT